jgi:hypothetical protein
MRDLKFRAWDTAKEQWIEGGYGFHILGEAMLIGGLFHDYGLLELNNVIIQEFTGLKDKNGIDIYEGDLIRHHKYGGEHVINWIAESCGFFVGEQSWPLSNLCTPNIEVIGNTFSGKAGIERK